MKLDIINVFFLRVKLGKRFQRDRHNPSNNNPHITRWRKCEGKQST